MAAVFPSGSRAILFPVFIHLFLSHYCSFQNCAGVFYCLFMVCWKPQAYYANNKEIKSPQSSLPLTIFTVFKIPLMTSFSSIKSNLIGYLLNCRISYMNITPQSLLCPLLRPPLKFMSYPTTICIYDVLYINILSPISVPRMSMGVVLTTGETYHMVPPEENRFFLRQLMGTSSRPTPTPAHWLLPSSPSSRMAICICFMKPSSGIRAPLWSHHVPLGLFCFSSQHYT